MRMPALFVGHGSPMNAIEDNRYSRAWRESMSDVPKPKAILSISAHWTTPGFGARVTNQHKPRQLYDFSGFPEELSSVSYSPLGDPKLADRVTKLLPGSRGDDSWGVDHGTWSVLAHVYPEADVPVVQLSLDLEKPFSWHFEAARRLTPLRDEGVLVLGSGNVVHNLKHIDYDSHASAYKWAEEADWIIATAIREERYSLLVDIFAHAQDIAKLAIPTTEHYLPLLYTLALKRPDERASFPVEGIAMGSISMRSVRVG